MQKKSSFNMFAAIAFLAGFILVHLFQLMLTSGHMGLPFSAILFDLALIALAVLLLMQQKKFFPAAAALLVGVIAIFYNGFVWVNIFLFLGWVALAFVLAAALMPELASVKETARKLYFVPAIILGLFELIRLFVAMDSIRIIFRYMGFFSGIAALLIFLVPMVCFAAGAFFAAKWAFEDESAAAPVRSMDGAAQPMDGAAQPMDGAAQPIGAAQPAAVPAEGEGFISMGKHVLLLLLTCGIWMYIWIYRTTAYTNRVQDEEQRDPTKKLLLCLFVPFYNIYWTYKTAQRVDKLSVQKGLPGDSATLMLILAIFIGIVPPIMLQDKINKIVTMSEGGMSRMAQPQAYQPAPQPYQPAPYQPAPQPYQPAPQPAAVPDASEALRNFKKLLDDGVITEEEFEAKKKQLLGL